MTDEIDTRDYRRLDLTEVVSGRQRKAFQMLGTGSTFDGKIEVMACVDADVPSEIILNCINANATTAFGLVCDATCVEDEVRLRPKGIHNVSSRGALQAWKPGNPAEALWAKVGDVKLKKVDGEWHGSFYAPGGWAGELRFARPPNEPSLPLRQLASWTKYKEWADEVRRSRAAVWFRGEGNNKYPLRTTYHRMERCRLERYCYSELRRFSSQAEAAMEHKFDLEDGADYATVVGLARHHGLPTPILDWTLSPYIAAFFAFSDVLDSDRNHNGESVRIYGLSQAFFQGKVLPTVIVPYVAPYVCTLEISPLHNPRLNAQQGVFLVSNVLDLESHILRLESARGVDNSLIAVEVPASFAGEAVRDLAFMGVTAGTLFPGLDGVGRMIRHEMLASRF